MYIIVPVMVIIILTAVYSLADESQKNPVIREEAGSPVSNIFTPAGEKLTLSCETTGDKPPDFSCDSHDVVETHVSHGDDTITQTITISVKSSVDTFKCRCSASSSTTEVTVNVKKRDLKASAAKASHVSESLTKELGTGLTVVILIAVLMISVVPVSWFVYKSAKPLTTKEEDTRFRRSSKSVDAESVGV
ncbi:uncharacterized protein LOC121386965 [Gigantopelta aegis]|uniref:uncharacterized protein LOC121386965 n=1 Tax=Gigantopelta aegis TaxID=1735272 RepID=UPI001B88AA28|nr:uncharacterized protein LOC121386965 [Gigantopelta aegis]XP_041373953.1 uncharacterized protein LOC121386965 [Gigantopelta aegis]